MLASKKAGFYVFFLTILSIIILVTALYKFSDTYNFSKFKDNAIGKKQLSILNISFNHELSMLYIEQAAKWKLASTIKMIGELGGFNKLPVCGSHHGYALWKSRGKPLNDCLPNFKSEFEALFRTQFSPFIRQLQLGNEKMYPNSFQYLGRFSYPFQYMGFYDYFVSYTNQAPFEYEYSIKPNFKVAVDYHAEDFQEIASKINNLVNEVQGCINLGGKSISNCFYDNFYRIVDPAEKDPSSLKTHISSTAWTASEPFQWMYDCDPEQKLLFDFSEHLEQCINSLDNQCTCHYTPISLSLGKPATFVIRLTTLPNYKVKASLGKYEAFPDVEGPFYSKFNLIPLSGAYNVNIAFDYSGKGLFQKADVSSDIENSEYGYSIPLFKQRVVPLEQVANNLPSQPKPIIHFVKKSILSSLQEYHKCDLIPADQTAFDICVKRKGQRIMFYDEEKKAVSFVEPIIKFAIDLS